MVVLTRRFVVRCAAAALSVASVGAQPAGQQAASASQRELVWVSATVTDRNGALVPNLPQHVFEIRDAGRVQPIVAFEAAPRPLHVMSMFDVSYSMERAIPLLRAAGEQLLAGLGGDDVAQVGTFGRQVTITPRLPRGSSELLKALPTNIEPKSPTFLWSALAIGIGAFGDPAPEHRRALIVFTDGEDTASMINGRPMSHSDVVEHAHRAAVTIYAIQPQSSSAQRGALPPARGLSRLAEETGGRVIEYRKGQTAAAASANVMDELRAQYSIGFVPSRRDGKVHAVEVRVADRNLRVRARKSYLSN